MVILYLITYISIEFDTKLIFKVTIHNPPENLISIKLNVARTLDNSIFVYHFKCQHWGELVEFEIM